jgi:hypothetical protein
LEQLARRPLPIEKRRSGMKKLQLFLFDSWVRRPDHYRGTTAASSTDDPHPESEPEQQHRAAFDRHQRLERESRVLYQSHRWKLGPDLFIQKPFTIEQFKRAVGTALLMSIYCRSVALCRRLALGQGFYTPEAWRRRPKFHIAHTG